MPHYVLQLENENEFAVYSTIVDNLITQPMPASKMRSWLSSHDYPSWLKPYDADEVIEDWMSDGMKQLLRAQARYFYWHEKKFCFAKLSDYYFCLPRRSWRR